MADATHSATWPLSAKRNQKIWAVYECLVHDRVIGARIAEKLSLNRSTVSRHIKKLHEQGYIVRSERFEDHAKRIQATSNRSVSGFSKIYVRGPRADEADIALARAKSEVGVRAEAEATPLPGGAPTLIDIHRIDINIPINENGPRDGMPRESPIEHWTEFLGASIPKKLNRGWAHWKMPPIQSEIGEWNVYLRRKGKYVDEEIEWGEFCKPNPVRITLPNRMWITPQEAMKPDEVRERVHEAIFHVSNQIQKLYGFSLGLPTSKSNQVFEAGAARYDPNLAEQVKKARKNGTGMLPLAPGITADGSHGLLNEGFVHLDCEDPQQAAFQANPVAALDFMMQEVRGAVSEMKRVADDSVSTIEEHAVSGAESIQNQVERMMMDLVERMHNTFEQRFQEHMNQFFEQNQERVDRAVARFEARLEGRMPNHDPNQKRLGDY